MTLNEYIKQLQAIKREIPTAGKLPVYYAKNEEGNGYDPIYFSPSICHTPQDILWGEHKGIEHGIIIVN